jgi:hypothetical protein
MDDYKIGFHVKCMYDLERLISIKGANLVELKPTSFRKKDGEKGVLYFFDGKKFKINHPVARRIKELCEEKNISIQVHMPFEKPGPIDIDTSLLQANKEHHDLILSRFNIFGKLLKKYGIGEVLTVHPPTYKVKNKIIFSREDALKAGTELYQKLDRLIIKKDYSFKVGIENVVQPKDAGSSAVGFKPKQIDRLLGYTSTIGITVDSGHRRLNPLMSVAKLFDYGPVVNMHFHSNKGIVSNDSYDDDEHTLATPDNLPNYEKYIKSIRRFHFPVVLEIDGLDEFTDRELNSYVLNLRKEIKLKK